MPVQMSLSGSESLSNKLQALRGVARGQTLERALTAGALIIQNAAKENAPHRSGTLRRSIHIGGHEDLNPDGIGGQVPGPEVAPTAVSVYVGTDLEYAAMQEFGGTIVPRNAARLHFTLADGTEVFARRVTIPAHPYLRPAMDENQHEVTREVAAALRDLLRAALR